MLSRAVKNATTDPIVMVLDIKARGASNKSSVIEVTDFFLKDNLISGFNAESKKAMGASSPAADRSMILSMNAYPNNIELRSMKTYNFGGGAAPAAEGEAGAEKAPVPAGSLTFEISNSVMAMPEKPMQAQIADPRVGYYSESYQVFSDAQERVQEKTFISRNRLEVKPEDMARYTS